MKNLDSLKQHGDVIWNIANLLRGPSDIPIKRHFYKYLAPRPLDEIAFDITTLKQDIMAMLKDATA